MARSGIVPRPRAPNSGRTAKIGGDHVNDPKITDPSEARTICVELNTIVGAFSEPWHSPPSPSAVQALQDLQDRGYLIVLMSGCHHHQIVGIQEWLARYQVPHDHRKRHAKHHGILGGVVDVVGIGYGIYETGS